MDSMQSGHPNLLATTDHGKIVQQNGCGMRPAPDAGVPKIAKEDHRSFHLTMIEYLFEREKWGSNKLGR